MTIVKLRHLPGRLPDGEAIAHLLFGVRRLFAHGYHSIFRRICTLSGAGCAAIRCLLGAYAPMCIGRQGRNFERLDPMDQRTHRLLKAPIGSTLVRLAMPNVVVMVVQAMIGLLETYFVAKLGVDALAAMALVFPPYMLLVMVSA